jgi:hypothetical protein
VCSFLPAIGILAYFLPNFEAPKSRRKRECCADLCADAGYDGGT